MLDILTIPQSEKIEPALQKIIDGIDDFSEVFNNRLDMNSNVKWQKSHLDDLLLLSKELSELKTKLIKIQNDNW